MTFKKLLLVSAFALPLLTAGASFANTPDQTVAKPAHTMKQECHGMKDMQMPETIKKPLHESMEKFHEENKPTMEAMKRTHKELQALLGAPTFSRDAYLAKATELETLKASLAQKHAEAFAGVAEKLSPQDRKTLAEKMPMMMGHHHGMHGEHGDWKGDKDHQHRQHDAGKSSAPAATPAESD